MEWILKYNYGIANIIHYLDDFFTAGPPHSQACQQNMSAMAQLCLEIDTPLRTEKTKGQLPQ